MSVDDIVLADDMFERVGVDQISSEHLEKPALTYWADVWRRFKENRLALFGLILLALIVACLLYTSRCV